MIRSPEKCIGDGMKVLVGHNRFIKYRDDNAPWHLQQSVIDEYADLVNELYDKHGLSCMYDIAYRLKEDAKRYGGRMSRKDAEQTAWQILCRVKLGK